MDLGASTSELQWIVDGYVLVLAGMLMFAGSVGDRFGRRRWMTFGLVVFALGTAIGGLADSVTVIGGYTFIDCTSLASITIPEKVTEIVTSTLTI